VDLRRISGMRETLLDREVKKGNSNETGSASQFFKGWA
jgi:hypothetical protein